MSINLRFLGVLAIASAVVLMFAGFSQAIAASAFQANTCEGRVEYFKGSGTTVPSVGLRCRGECPPPNEPDCFPKPVAGTINACYCDVPISPFDCLILLDTAKPRKLPACLISAACTLSCKTVRVKKGSEPDLNPNAAVTFKCNCQ